MIADSFSELGPRTKRIPACLIGTIDYVAYTNTMASLFTRLARPATAREPLDQLSAIIPSLKEKSRREDANTHMEKITQFVDGNRSQYRDHLGHLFEAVCADNQARLPDLAPIMRSCSDYLYAWDAEKGETIYRFFAYLGDYTVDWASQASYWRAIVPPDALRAPAEAMDALNPTEMRKILETADNGEVFSREEAEQVAEWWTIFRKTARRAARADEALFIALCDED